MVLLQTVGNKLKYRNKNQTAPRAPFILCLRKLPSPGTSRKYFYKTTESSVES